MTEREMIEMTGSGTPKEVKGHMTVEIDFTLLKEGKIEEFNMLYTKPNWYLDLAGKDLAGLNLAKIVLRGANLRRANLYGADLHIADLAGADLMEANIGLADLTGANLMGANLRGAYLRMANLRMAICTAADFAGANIDMANLTGVNLAGARGIISIGPIGSRGDILYVVWHPRGPMIKTGCFWGTLAEFEKRVKHHHDKRVRKEYKALIPFIKSWWKNNSEV